MTPTPTSDLIITPAAHQKLSSLLVEESAAQGAPVRLRLSVSSGGCSGFQYALSFDGLTTPDDLVMGDDIARVVVDSISWDYLKGSTLDYASSLMGSALVLVSNPNATLSCGCGTSFSVF